MKDRGPMTIVGIVLAVCTRVLGLLRPGDVRQKAAACRSGSASSSRSLRTPSSAHRWQWSARGLFLRPAGRGLGGPSSSRRRVAPLARRSSHVGGGRSTRGRRLASIWANHPGDHSRPRPKPPPPSVMVGARISPPPDRRFTAAELGPTLRPRCAVHEDPHEFHH